MMTNPCVSVLCKKTRGGVGGTGGGQASSATLIWQCDVINDEKRMNMTKKDWNAENVLHSKK